MAFGFFKKGDGNGAGGGGAGQDQPRQRDPDKARKWFQHAHTAADSRQHDFAVECFISGLRFSPDSVAEHEALREVARRRKVAGGKPAGLKEKILSGGKDPVDRMLHAEKLWAKDPLNISMMVAMMERAVEAAEAETELNLEEVAYWVGEMVLEEARTRKARAADLEKVGDLFARMTVWDKAVHAFRVALSLDQSSDEIRRKLHRAEAENTIVQGKYDAAGREDGQFQQSVRDRDKQQELEAEDQMATGSKLDLVIERRREELAEAPEDVDRIVKLAEALLRKERPEPDEEAVQLYEKAHDKTKQYRFKMRIGDVRMREFNRRMRELRVKAKEDDTARERLQELARERLQFELKEYAERAKNYPTDMTFRFELARRLYAVKKYDEAIGELQLTTNSPKLKAASHEMLARCFAAKGWLDETVDTLRKGVEAHAISGDRQGLELRYLLMDALVKSAERHADDDRERALSNAREAQQIASGILQEDISFRDIRERVEQTRQLAEKLSKKPGAA